MSPSQIAVVAIGRNEGERLRRCLDSVLGLVGMVVYVDSGSTDGSVEMARRRGVEVVELDMGIPFTAARARNAGFARALELQPAVKYVQFVDGDCEVVPGWLTTAVDFLEGHAEVAAVCGWRRERYPDRSIYNLLCDLDWNDWSPGPVRMFGGDVMIRAVALHSSGGYRDDLIAGEEPELSVRLRAGGWTLQAMGVPMTMHDAAITRFGQWWKRTLRTGYAYAQGAHLHGAPPERHFVKPLRSALVWGVALPAVILALVAIFGPVAAWLFLLYPIQVLRVLAKTDGPLRQRALRGAFIVVGKFAEAQGSFRFLRTLLARRHGELIEYK